MAAVLMQVPAVPARCGGILVQLGYLYLLLMLVAIGAVLLAAMVMQYAFGEIPCPLCLLQRVALFGAASGIAAQFRHGFSWRNVGISMVFALFLLIVAVRQTLLDIAPRPGHAYVGSAVLGLHMPVWSILIAVALLAGYALAMVLFGGGPAIEVERLAAHPALARAGQVTTWALIALCAVNFGSAVLQCGLGQCHTMGYRLLGTLPADAS